MRIQCPQYKHLQVPISLSLLSLVTTKVAHTPSILSLDGGGVRGLSSLLILKSIMEQIKRKTKAETVPRPCEYFDLICGTSTGGLIAIMLGKLGMVPTLTRGCALIVDCSRMHQRIS